MPENDLFSNVLPSHLKAGSIYNTAQTTGSVDMSLFTAGVLLIANILSVVSDTCSFVLQHSDDDSNWEATEYSWTEPVTAAAHSTYAFVHPNKVKRYIRLRFVPNGTVNGASVNAVGLTLHSGVKPATATYGINTGI